MNTPKFTIRLEEKNEHHAVEALTREAFWNVYRPGCLEHYVLHCFRRAADFIPQLDLLMEQDGQLIGHVMYVHSTIQTEAGETIPTCTFGPLSIAPAFQKQGYGTALLEYSMQKAEELGFGAVAITGNPAFYGKLGFVAGKSVGILYRDDPDAEYFLVKELKQGFLSGVSGVYADPKGYFVDEAEAERFDASFPPKEKKRLPGQLMG